MDPALVDRLHANRLHANQRVAAISNVSAGAHVGPWLLIDTGEPSFAAANSATPVVPVAAHDVSTAIDWFASRGAAFHFAVRPEHDAALYEELMKRGYVKEPSERVLLLRSPRPPAYNGALSMRAVQDARGIEAYGSVGWPRESRRIGIAIARTAASLGGRLLLGEVDGAPVASSMVMVTGDVAGIYNVGVEPEYRRRGFGTAITWAAIAAGLAGGATTFWTGATAMGLGVYLAMGFEECFDYLHLVPSGRG